MEAIDDVMAHVNQWVENTSDISQEIEMMNSLRREGYRRHQRAQSPSIPRDLDGTKNAQRNKEMHAAQLQRCTSIPFVSL